MTTTWTDRGNTYRSRFSTLAEAWHALDKHVERRADLGQTMVTALELLKAAKRRALTAEQVIQIHRMATVCTRAYPRIMDLLRKAAMAGKRTAKFAATLPGGGVLEVSLAKIGDTAFVRAGDVYLGRIDDSPTAYPPSSFVSGRGELTQDHLDLLDAIEADPAKVASQHGVATGRCSFCRRLLSTKESRAVGYGPDCAETHGLPWGHVPDWFDAEGRHAQA